MNMIFISHAHEDSDAARQISIALAAVGLNPWLDAQELRSGDELLKTIAAVLAEAEYFAIVLSRMALTKSWVLTELRMALTAEIERTRPKVVVLRVDDCEIPVELRHKLHLDFRGRFDDALKELAAHVSGIGRAVATPKQTILAEMIADADVELWTRLSGNVREGEWKQSEVADMIRDLRSDELEAAVLVGSKWSGLKLWDSDLLNTIRRATKTSEAGARRISKRLAAAGFLDEADDLDYSEQPECAWYAGGILRILYPAARRSGLFPLLLPPLPERLSGLLASERPVCIIGKGWYAQRFAVPVVTVLDSCRKAVVAVARVSDPGRTWVFQSSTDRHPLRAERYFTPTDLRPDPLTAASDSHETELRGGDLVRFDDLRLLQG